MQQSLDQLLFPQPGNRDGTAIREPDLPTTAPAHVVQVHEIAPVAAEKVPRQLLLEGFQLFVIMENLAVLLDRKSVV